MREWSELELQAHWKQRLQSKIGEESTAKRRQATYSGLPFGDPDIVTQLEHRHAWTVPLRLSGGNRNALLG
jgi:hypothetical protein